MNNTTVGNNILIFYHFLNIHIFKASVFIPTDSVNVPVFAAYVTVVQSLFFYYY